MKRPTAQRLQDIIEAIQTAEEVRPATREEFDGNRLSQLGLTKLVEIVGEAANHVAVEVRDKHAEIPWRQIVSMRNRTTHSYFELDLDILWEVVTVELPALLPQILAILDELEQSTPATE